MSTCTEPRRRSDPNKWTKPFCEMATFLLQLLYVHNQFQRDFPPPGFSFAHEYTRENQRLRELCLLETSSQARKRRRRRKTRMQENMSPYRLLKGLLSIQRSKWRDGYRTLKMVQTGSYGGRSLVCHWMGLTDDFDWEAMPYSSYSQLYRYLLREPECGLDPNNDHSFAVMSIGYYRLVKKGMPNELCRLCLEYLDPELVEEFQNSNHSARVKRLNKLYY